MSQWCDANWLALAAEKSLKKCLIFHVIMLASIVSNEYSATMCTSSHWAWPQILCRLHFITVGLHCITATATRSSQRRCLGDVYLTSEALALRWQVRVGSVCLHAGKITSQWCMCVCVWGAGGVNDVDRKRRTVALNFHTPPYALHTFLYLPLTTFRPN